MIVHGIRVERDRLGLWLVSFWRHSGSTRPICRLSGTLERAQGVYQRAVRTIRGARSR